MKQRHYGNTNAKIVATESSNHTVNKPPNRSMILGHLNVHLLLHEQVSYTQTQNTTAHNLRRVNLIYQTNLTDWRPCSPRRRCQLVTGDKTEENSRTLCTLV